MKTTMRLFLLLCAVFMASQPVLAQNDEDTRNKAVITTDDGDRQLITDEISVIRFDGSKVTVVQPWGETVFDRTLRSLTFLRPLPGTLRLTVNVSKDDNSGSTRGYSIDSDENLASTWSSTDRVYVYADAISPTPIGILSPVTYGTTVSTMTGNITADGLSTGQTIFLSTQPRPYSFAAQSGEIGSTGLFYLTAEPTITITGANASVANTTFEMAQAVVRFTLVRNTTGKALNIYGLTVEGGSETITVTPNQSNPPAQVYVGMPENTTSTTYYLTGVDGDDNEWTGTVTAPILAGHYYRANVTMTKKTIPTVTAPTANTPTYNGSAQALVTAGSTTGGVLQYSLTSGSGYSTSIPTATDAGNYTVYYKVVGNYTYTDVAESSVDVTIDKATYAVDGTATATAAYGTQVKDIAISGLTVKDVSNNPVAGSWAFTSTDVPSVGNSTAYTATFTPTSADDNYNALTMDITPVITAVSASVTTAPAAVTGDLTYSGSAQALVTGGDATGGTLKYFVNTTGTAPSIGDAGWEDSAPTGTAAGTYYVWYYVAGDGNHSSTAVTAIEGASKAIGQKALTITADDQTIDYGTSIATGTTQVTSSGLVAGDDLTFITLTASGSDVTTSGTITPSAAETTNGIGNYSVTYTAGNLTITAVSASVTTAPAAVTGDLTYSGSAQALVTEGTATGGTLKYFVNTTGAAPTTETGGWEDSAPTGTDAGTYYVWYYVAGDGNHTSTAVTAIEGASKAIGQKQVTISNITANSKTYDGTTEATLVYPAITTAMGLVDGDNLTITATGTFADASVGTGKTVNISDLTLGGTSVANYVLAGEGQQTTTTADITAATITPTVSLSGWTYGSPNEPSVTGNTGNGTVTYYYKTGTEDWTTTQPTAAGDHQVKASIAANGNYAAAESAVVEFTISQKSVTVDGITASNKTYDGNTTATLVYTAVIITGKVGSDDLSVTATGTFADANVGTGKTVTISDLTLGGASVANYVLAGEGQQTTTTADITAANFTPVVTLAGWTYGSPNAPSVGETNISGGTITYSYKTGDAAWTETQPTAAGDHQVKASIAANGNYAAVETAPVSFTISPKPVTISGITASNKTYDGSTDAELVYPSITTAMGLISGDNLTVSATGTFDNANAGTGKTVNISGLTLGGSSVANYVLAGSGQQTSATATISKATLTATAADASRNYGADNPAFTVNVTGFVNSETASNAADYSAPIANTTATSGSNVGTYNITPSGGSATNYNFSYVNGTLTINKADGEVGLSKTGIRFKAQDGENAECEFTIIKNISGGALSVSSSNGNYVTAELHNVTVKLERKTKQEETITITVTSAATENYKEASATCNVQLEGIEDSIPE